MATSRASKRPCPGSATTSAIYDGRPVLYDATENGRLYVVCEEDLGCLRVLHLKGSAFEMGRAQGLLLRNEIVQIYDEFLEWFSSNIDLYLRFLPKPIRDLIEKAGIEAALDLEISLTKYHTPARFLDEMRGLSSATGVSYRQVHRLQLIPELVNISCTILGAWGPGSHDGRLVQLRALDWGLGSPLYKYPLLVVYHPTEQRSHPHAVLTWPGLIGALTGFSHYVGMSQKDWIKSEPPGAWVGIPANFLLSEILCYDATVRAAINRIKKADRTCTIFVGLGDHKSPKNFRILEFSDQDPVIWTDKTDHGYPVTEGLLYVDKYKQPSKDPCLPSLMKKLYGKLSMETILRQVVPVSQTGDLHLAVYDYSNDSVAIGVATRDSVSGQMVPAYQGPFVRLDMGTLFAWP